MSATLYENSSCTGSNLGWVDLAKLSSNILYKDYTQLRPLVYNNDNSSKISSIKLDNGHKIRLYVGKNHDESSELHTGNGCVAAQRNDRYRSAKICASSVPNNECFENRSYVPSHDYTNNYIFVLLLIVGFFYICKIK